MAAKQVVFITGANTGLGYEVVKSLLQSSERAYRIFLGGRSLEKANEARAKLKDEAPETASSVETVQIDITDEASVQRAHETVKSAYGHVDILINNAGTHVHQRTCRGDDEMLIP